MQRLHKISLGLLIAAALLIPTSAWFLTPTPAHAATTVYPVWCGAWDPNPDNLLYKQKIPGSQFVNYGGHSFAIFEGEDSNNSQWYYYAYEANGTEGDQIALAWLYNANNVNYQCGDGNARIAATVWSGTTDTWTAGVPANQVVTDYRSSPPYVYVEILYWPAGGASDPIQITVQ